MRAHLAVVDEYHHTLITAPIYCLIPVPNDEVEQWIAEAKKERDA